MTVAEFLQQLVGPNRKCQDPDKNAILFIVTQITGDPTLADQGQVWIGQGAFAPSTDGTRLEALTLLYTKIQDTAHPPSSYEASLSVDINGGTLTVHPVGALPIRAYHLPLQYFNGVLYGTATHYGYDPDTHTLGFLPGPVFTLTINCGATIII